MTEVTTVDVTPIDGSDVFPVQSNDPYVMIEKIARQTIRSAKNANALEDAFFDYEVDKGKVIEEAVIKMAERQAFDKDAFTREAHDAAVLCRYFNNYKGYQYETTTRPDDVRAILLQGGNVDSVVAEIIDTLTQGEGKDDFNDKREMLLTTTLVDFASILGGNPANMKGVIYAIREAYNHLKSNNDDLTLAEQYVSATPVDDIRILMSDALMNLIDVVELANIFNLSKEEILGKIVIVPVSDYETKYKVVVYDRKAFGRATRLYEYDQEKVAKGRYFNHYLTTDRAYFFNGLFKATSIDCSTACESAKAELITTV